MENISLKYLQALRAKFPNINITLTEDNHFMLNNVYKTKCSINQTAQIIKDLKLYHKINDDEIYNFLFEALIFEIENVNLKTKNEA